MLDGRDRQVTGRPFPVTTGSTTDANAASHRREREVQRRHRPWPPVTPWQRDRRTIEGEGEREGAFIGLGEGQDKAI